MSGESGQFFVRYGMNFPAKEARELKNSEGRIVNNALMLNQNLDTLISSGI